MGTPWYASNANPWANSWFFVEQRSCRTIFSLHADVGVLTAFSHREAYEELSLKRWRTIQMWAATVKDSICSKTRTRSAIMCDVLLLLMRKRNEVDCALKWFPPKRRRNVDKLTDKRAASNRFGWQLGRVRRQFRFAKDVRVICAVSCLTQTEGFKTELVNGACFKLECNPICGDGGRL